MRLFDTELGGPATPLERMIKACSHDPGRAPLLPWLQRALELSRGRSDLNAMRSLARRNRATAPALLKTLCSLGEVAGEESHDEWYAMMELTHSASVGVSNLRDRLDFCETLAAAAAASGRMARAREASADALECAQIIRRVAIHPAKQHAGTEEAIQARRENVREVGAEPRELLAPMAEDPGPEWCDLILWNSDLGSSEGLLAQTDAVLRTAIRLEHWRDNCGNALEPVVESMLTCMRRAGEGDPLLTPIGVKLKACRDSATARG